jgi:SSS family solute:Na+ symporter
MAQNFWIAIFAWSTCFVVTILISLLTEAHAESTLRGLVYGLTELPTEEGVPWFKRPVPLALVVIVALTFLNLIFL